MPRAGLASSALGHPVVALVSLFLIWKALLLVVAYSSPGAGYDSSSSLLFHPPTGDFQVGVPGSWSGERPTSLTEKLTRWDAVYFGAIAERGYLFEQEWAFGWGFTRSVAVLTRGLRLANVGAASTPNAAPETEIWVAIILAHAAHLLAVLVLFRLTETIFPRSTHGAFSLVSAALHVLSPGGLFLSAPYAETSFSCLSFLGCLFYVWSLAADESQRPLAGDLCVSLAGLLFGIATTFRSNGLLNGVPFLHDACLTIARLCLGAPTLPRLRRLTALVAGGLLVGAGFVIPQWIAHSEYCLATSALSDTGRRPWCDRSIPSIYSWVQENYWNVGFMRYWTVSNLPLFLLAAPMLAVLSVSAVEAMRHGISLNPTEGQPSRAVHPAQGKSEVGERSQRHQQKLAASAVQRFAVPQLLLAVLAFTSYHVQIITRISCGCVVWYWWLASVICTHRTVNIAGQDWDLSKLTVRWMVIYAVVQGGLFASFLPPA
ncbi:MAG: ER membrane glycoprotein subunit of the GPI transamidase complex-like protein [Thelocarpon impressellum]|nr:MAG: ER membrane glycoprotein subunit of the GPI transamidase complex-like protein [Thelocarpon impressellum]